MTDQQDPYSSARSAFEDLDPKEQVSFLVREGARTLLNCVNEFVTTITSDLESVVDWERGKDETAEEVSEEQEQVSEEESPSQE